VPDPVTPSAGGPDEAGTAPGRRPSRRRPQASARQTTMTPGTTPPARRAWRLSRQTAVALLGNLIVILWLLICLLVR
jgi:hypothetical protein